MQVTRAGFGRGALRSFDGVQEDDLEAAAPGVVAAIDEMRRRRNRTIAICVAVVVALILLNVILALVGVSLPLMTGLILVAVVASIGVIAKSFYDERNFVYDGRMWGSIVHAGKDVARDGADRETERSMYSDWDMG